LHRPLSLPLLPLAWQLDSLLGHFSVLPIWLPRNGSQIWNCARIVRAADRMWKQRHRKWRALCPPVQLESLGFRFPSWI
jgi:hypothetical protein